MGSANEMIEHLETAVALGYVSQDTCQPYIEQYIIVAKQLNKLIQNWRKLQPPISNLQPPISNL